ncbi:hypothetical protein BJF85_13965 [Saccharomonospora sp. CUA-673]|uniref:hypothetical protein n=1 Tax=Saccharomonospora sp. CUA-673 TaxID=1904969 RepID=UPI00095B9FD4|nr:hypothetical protein [Saccharomonospora sp. CUA-673]OLT47988.1 hypothetical protein BJF85_13965 [Saccharomonospora sp. CUA-673]
MLWLFGQMWLWLLIAFALGALSMALVQRATQLRDDRYDNRDDDPDDAAPRANRYRRERTWTALPPIPAGERAEEQTGMLPATGTLDDEPDPTTDPTDATAHTRHPGARANHRSTRARTPRTPDVEQPVEGRDGTVLGALDEGAGTGRTSGTLPPRRAWHARNEWPDEADAHASEHDIPRSGG